MFGVELGNYGPSSLVALFVIAIALGYLVPRWMHIQRIKDKDELIANLRKALDKRDEQFDKLIASVEVAVRTIEELKTQANGVRAAEARRTS